ncbi:hypothetical protein ACHAWF_004793 [Thalassiosira exigua]
MDFVSLIGPSAHLAKQLELRWFYRWELEAGESSAKSNCRDPSRRAPPRGRLVRKRLHSMPFLRRNVDAANDRKGVLRRRVDQSDDMVVRDALSRENQHGCVPIAAGSFGKSGASKRVGGDICYAKGRKRSRSGNSASLATKSQSASSSEHEPPSKESSRRADRMAELRQTVLGRIPPELRHDETFVMERVKQAEQEEATVSDRKHTIQNSGASHVKTEAGSALGHGAASDGCHQLPVNTQQSTLAPMILPSYACLPSSNGGERTHLGPALPKGKQRYPPGYFHYLYMQPNGVLASFVEDIKGRMCPFCNFDGGDSSGLVQHLERYHGTLRENNNAGTAEVVEGHVGANSYFEAVLGEEGQLHVIVRGFPTSLDPSPPPIRPDFVFVRPRLSSKNRRKENQSAIPFIERKHHKAESLDAATRNKRLLALQASDAPASAISAYLPGDAVPIRQYFHARTNLPMTRGEWSEDSDGGEDDEWLHEMSSELLDEFEDVSDREKKFMKLWNRFIRCNHVIADRDVPRKCHEFISKHQKELHEGGLRLNLLLHLFNLWDSCVISSNGILSCMAMYDQAESY